MTESEHRKWDIISKFGAGITTLATIILGLFQYFHSQEQASELEFNRAVWKDQRDAYVEATKTAGSIASVSDNEIPQQLREEFLSLYWGKMSFVEDDEVVKSMKEFKLALGDHSPLDRHLVNDLKIKANELAIACKESSERYWEELK